MGFVDIRFEGICTQIKLGLTLAVGERRVYHRAVLVDAKEGMPEKKVPPHYAFLALDQLFIKNVSREIVDEELPALRKQKDGNWQMCGVRLHVANAVEGGLTYMPSSYIYSLTRLTRDFGALSNDVVFGANAACHFDVSSGTFSGLATPRRALFTLLRIETDGDDPVLAIEDMVHGGSGTITLTSGATVVMTNTGGKQRGDSANDFLLHYLVADKMPPHPVVPPEMAPGDGNEGLGPGCSNSNYP